MDTVDWHRVACIAYFVSYALHCLKKTQKKLKMG